MPTEGARPELVPRVESLEREIEALRAELIELRDGFAALKRELGV